MPKNTIEKGKIEGGSVESQAAPVAVHQPELAEVMSTINLMGDIAERAGEDKSSDMGGGGGSSSGSQVAAGSVGQSARDIAIAKLPQTEQALRKQLKAHIEQEVKVLRKEVKKAARKASKPGTAYHLNELHAKIRRLNSLLSSLLEASMDVLKRMAVRIFVDKQPIL